MNNIKVSLISTLKNEECTITEFLDSLLNQSRLPNEIIIVDGGSTDRTVDIINSYVETGAPIKLIVRSGVNIAQGRNIAIENAKYEIIASTDAGCRIDHQWLESLIKPFIANQNVDVVSGWYEPDAKTEFEMCLAELKYPKLKKVLQNSDRFLPSSRSVAYKKKCWQKVGGYPEWLYTAEDTMFDLNLKMAGYNFVFAPYAIVFWKVRGNLRDAFKQFYLYSEGDGKAGLFPKRYYYIMLPYFIGFFMLISGFEDEVKWAILSVLVLAYMSIPIMKAYKTIKSFNAFLEVPILWIIIDIANIYGYISGTFKRIFRLKTSNYGEKFQ